MKALRLALASLALCGSACFAHQDTVLTLAPDGTLAGLPAAHAPARLKLGFASVQGAQHVAALALELRGARIELPMCVLGLLNTERVGDMQASASWYHDEAVVSHYISLKFFDPGDAPAASSKGGFSLLFDLRSARLIEMTVDVVHARERRVQSIPVDLRARCGEDEARAFMAVPGAVAVR